MLKAGPYIIASICLIAGALLYVTSRENILFLDLLNIHSAPSLSLKTGNPFMNWVVFSLPDGLWYWALLLIQSGLLNRKSFVSRLCMYVAVVLPFLIEVLQAYHLIRGTFDWIDIITYLFTLILFLLCVGKDSLLSVCKWLH